MEPGSAKSYNIGSADVYTGKAEADAKADAERRARDAAAYKSPSLFGEDLLGDPIEQPSRGKLADDFFIPPFSVLNAREGWWRERKRAWIALGIKSEIGRGANLLQFSDGVNSFQATGDYNAASPGGSARPACDYSDRERGSGSGQPIAGTAAGGVSKELWDASQAKKPAYGISNAEATAKYLSQNRIKPANRAFHEEGMLEGYAAKEKRQSAVRPGGGDNPNPGRDGSEEYEGGDAWIASGADTGTSIFDPVLCELCYRWFCPHGGMVIDPFAGGSVRGVVAGCLGRRYFGMELQVGQLVANEVQAANIEPDPLPRWQLGDSVTDFEAAAPWGDFLFSCPPYGDLESYSDDPRDLSTMTHEKFLAAYREIIRAACRRLQPDRFAAFVVGDFRDAKGRYRNFCCETISAFKAAGLDYYNEAILVTSVGSLSIRIKKQWEGARKLGKTHQQVLVFCKGDGAAAAAVCERGVKW
jgi:hypothetical protein